MEEFGDSYLSRSFDTEALEVEQEPQVTTEKGLSLMSSPGQWDMLET